MQLEDNLIIGVSFKKIKSFPDQRGFFREIIRYNDPIFEGYNFAQWSHSKMTKNVVKAWHYHHVQLDWWYVPLGHIEAILIDNREESPTYKKKLIIPMGETNSEESVVCVRIPQGVLHGCKVISEEAHLMYITSEIYNPNDEGRFPYNSEMVEHDWGVEAITIENDRRTFTPTAERKLLK